MILCRLGIHFHTKKILNKKGKEKTERVDWYWIRFWKKCKFCTHIGEYERLG